MHYQNKDEFRCLDSNQRFPMSYVNDDYCDCDDGSDEPGTSACSNGRFEILSVFFRKRKLKVSPIQNSKARYLFFEIN